MLTESIDKPCPRCGCHMPAVLWVDGNPAPHSCSPIELQALQRELDQIGKRLADYRQAHKMWGTEGALVDAAAHRAFEGAALLRQVMK